MADMIGNLNTTSITATSGEAKLTAGLSKFMSMGRQQGMTKEAIDRAASDFESVFLSQMLQHMFSEVDVNELFGGGEAEEIYRSLMVDEYGKLISKSGGVGVADYVKHQLLETQALLSGKTTVSQEDFVLMQKKSSSVSQQQRVAPSVTDIKA